VTQKVLNDDLTGIEPVTCRLQACSY